MRQNIKDSVASCDAKCHFEGMEYVRVIRDFRFHEYCLVSFLL